MAIPNRLSFHGMIACLLLVLSGNISCDDSGKKSKKGPVCGNGIVEGTETCDGNCPVSCETGNACRTGILEGSPEECNVTCREEEKQFPECGGPDGCCPEGCEAEGDPDCPGNRPGVVLVLAREYAENPGIRSRLDRYMHLHPEHEFHEILLEVSADPVESMEDRGGEIKRNWVEVRNTILDMQAGFPLLQGVWVVADRLPLIWRESELFAIFPSSFKPSIYPLTALGDVYAVFDSEAGGFIEKEGVTRGRGRGDSYRADLWGAALVPPAGWGNPHGQIMDYLDRNHAWKQQEEHEGRLMVADTFGHTTLLAPRIRDAGFFDVDQAIFLAPNSCPELSGFDSQYLVMVHDRGPDFIPHGSGGCIMTSSPEQLTELEQWEATEWFEDQAEFRRIGDDRCYFFSLRIRERSVSPEILKAVFEAHLPELACHQRSCHVWVQDNYFTNASGHPLDGRWNGYNAQMQEFFRLYTETLQSGEVLYGYLSAHGAPDMHDFFVHSSNVHDGGFSATVMELQSCSTADSSLSDIPIAFTYLFFGGAQVVIGYGQQSLMQCEEGNCFDYMRFLHLRRGEPVIEALFDRDYSMHLYLGDPLLVL